MIICSNAAQYKTFLAVNHLLERVRHLLPTVGINDNMEIYNYPIFDGVRYEAFQYLLMDES